MTTATTAALLGIDFSDDDDRDAAALGMSPDEYKTLMHSSAGVDLDGDEVRALLQSELGLRSPIPLPN